MLRFLKHSVYDYHEVLGLTQCIYCFYTKLSLYWYKFYREWWTLQNRHKFHIVAPSPWPFLASMGALMFTFGFVVKVHNYGTSLLMNLGLVLILFVSTLWWRDVVRESTYLGFHTVQVQKGIKLGVILFIISELMLFFSFFWAFFHASLSPSIAVGAVWPPIGINTLNPLKIPLLNTLILLLSGLTLTWSHKFLLNFNLYTQISSDFTNVKTMRFYQTFLSVRNPLIFTIVLGFMFTLWQLYEYKKAGFYIYDGIYGSTFYMTTGLHGFHVLVGSIFLFVCLIRFIRLHFDATHHVGYESAIWYWHFVDVIWIFLFLVIYCWGTGYANFFNN